MSHAHKADKLLIKPTAGARPAPPCHPDGSFPRHATRPVTRRVTSSTETPGWQPPQTDQPNKSHSPPRRQIRPRLDHSRRQTNGSGVMFGRGMADNGFEHPRLAAIYDALDDDRSDLDVYAGIAEE